MHTHLFYMYCAACVQGQTTTQSLSTPTATPPAATTCSTTDVIQSRANTPTSKWVSCHIGLKTCLERDIIKLIVMVKDGEGFIHAVDMQSLELNATTLESAAECSLRGVTQPRAGAQSRSIRLSRCCRHA